MNKVLKKCIAAILTIGVGSCFSIGCGTSDASSSKGAKGRYVEKKIELPEEAKNQKVFQMEKSSEGYPVLYACSAKEKGVYKYTLNAEGKWKKENVEWLKDIEIKDPNNLYSANISVGENGDEYFRYTTETEDLYSERNIFKKNANNMAENFTIDGWGEDYQDSEYVIPRITLLKNGNLLCTNSNDNKWLALYEKDTNKKLFEKNDVQFDVIILSRTIAPYKDGFMCFTGDGKSQDAKYLSLFDKDGNEIKKVGFEQSKFDDQNDLCVGENDTIIMCNKNGIHKLNNDNDTWETLVDGDLISLSSPTLYESGIIESSNDSYYILYDSESGPELMNYYYDKDAVSSPKTEISVYGLQNDDTVQEAISTFQRNNPDVKINFRFSMDEDDEGNKTDYIKTLNTEILSGDGPDIIVLDNLPLDSYIEKGALVDISDVIKPMSDSGMLLPNVIKNCEKEGKIYAVPARMSINVVYGNKDMIKSASTIEDLRKCSEENKGENLFGCITYDDLLGNLLPSELTDIYDKNNSINKEKLVKYLDNIKAMGDNINCKKEYEENEGTPSDFELSSDSKLYFEDTKNTPSFELGMVKYIEGSFTSYEKSYTPLSQIGINSSSKNVEICKEFIKTLLSEEVQNKEIYDNGFPVNKNSLNNWVNKDYDDFQGEVIITAADGTEVPLKIKWPDKDQYQKIEEICLNANKKCINDEFVVNVIKEQSKEFFNGNITSDKAADNIMKELKVYLSEKN